MIGGPAEFVSALVRWWFAELAGTFPARMRAWLSQAPQPLHVLMDGRGISILDRAGEAAERRALIEIDHPSSEELAAAIGARIDEWGLPRDRVVIEVGAGKFLDPVVELPIAAASELNAVLALEIDRHCPFPVTSAYFDFRVLDSDEEHEVVVVQLYIVSAKDVDWLIDAVRAAGLSPVRVTSSIDAGAGKGFDMRPPGLDPVRQSRASLRIAVLSLAVMVMVVVTIYVPIRKLQESLAEAETQLADLLSRDEASSDRAARLRTRLADLLAVAAIRSDRPPALTLINEISRWLPDHSYLTQLKIDRSRVQISGLTENATDVVRGFERSLILENARFPAPVTRMGDTGLERFDLLLDVGRSRSGDD